MTPGDDAEDSHVGDPQAGHTLPIMLEPTILAALVTALGAAGVEGAKAAAVLRRVADPRFPLSVVARASFTEGDRHRISLLVENGGAHGVVLTSLSRKDGKHLFTEVEATVADPAKIGASKPPPPRPIRGMTLDRGKGVTIRVDLARMLPVPPLVASFVTLRLSYVVLGCGEDARQGVEFPVAILDPHQEQPSPT